MTDKSHEFHSGQTPAVSDYQLLEIGRRLEMYGIRLHPAKDREGTKLSLAVAHTGVLVFQVGTKVENFIYLMSRIGQHIVVLDGCFCGNGVEFSHVFI